MSGLLLVIPVDTDAASLVYSSVSISSEMTKDCAGLITIVRDCHQIVLKFSTVGPRPLSGCLRLLPVYYQVSVVWDMVFIRRGLASSLGLGKATRTIYW